MRVPRAVVLALALATTIGSVPVTTSGATGPTTATDEDLQIEVLSTRPGTITGGDALVGVELPDNVEPSGLTVTVDDRDVTQAFEEGRGADLVGLVDSLDPGDSLIEAQHEALSGTASLEVTNHPIEGSVFSGPHQEPFVCRTSEAGLGPPTDEDCSAPTKVQYYYQENGTWHEIDDPDQAPDSTNTARNGEPMIVRVESGTINRAIYRFAVLDDGHLDEDGKPGPGWNDKLVYSFFGGCDVGYDQGLNAPEDILLPLFLQRGYAIATSTLNIGRVNCNDVLGAETAMMVKEHVQETLGPARYTLGQGGSGGAIQAQLVAENYPGILDGLLVNSVFPDAISIGPGITDCRLLNQYFDQADVPWTTPQRTAVSGFAPMGPPREIQSHVPGPIRPVCENIDRAFGDTVVAEKGCGIPDPLVYDAKTNPTGARCTVYDDMVNVLGRVAGEDRALRPLSNVGVQYGLEALNEGWITVEHFLELNAEVGGYDADGHVVDDRTQADPGAAETAYATGRVVTGAGGLGETPVIALASDKDHQGNPHDLSRYFALQNRIEDTRGDHRNYVVYRQPGAPGAGFGIPLDDMDQWLETLAEDESDRAHREKVLDARPDQVHDKCWLPQGNSQPDTSDPTALTLCNALYHSHETPRLRAGAPTSNDVLQCQLKPIDPGDYAVAFTPMQRDRLEEIFPSGVCDWSKPGVGQGAFAGVWQSHGG